MSAYPLRAALTTIFSLLSAGDVAAQVLVWQASAAAPPPANYTSSNTYFGDTAHALNDVNNDGYVDWLVGNPNAANGNAPFAGWVGVLSGIDGSVMVQWAGTLTSEYLHTRGTPGDIDGDGAWDALIYRKSSAGVPFTAFYSCVTGALIQSFAGGGGPLGRVWKLHDWNNDGITEYVDVPYYWNGAYIRDGSSSATLVWMPSTLIAQAFGIDFRTVPDEDGDGHRDILAGLPGQRCTTGNLWYGYDIGRFRIYSSATGGMLKEFIGDAQCDRYGLGADTLGDVTGDGVSDYVVAQPGLNAMRTLDGATGATVLSSSWPSNCPVGCYTSPLEGVGDVDGDGIGDFAGTHIASPIPLYAEVRRGTDHALLMTIPSPTLQGFALGTGSRLVACGDEDGDGFFEVLVSSFGPPGGSGLLRKFSLRPVGVQPFGIGCGAGGGTPPRIAAGGSLKTGATFTTSVAGVPATSDLLLVLGTSQTSAYGLPLPLDLSFVGGAGCSLLTSMDVIVGRTAEFRPDGTYGSTVAIGIPSLPVLIGATFYGQWAALDTTTGALSVTRGLAATIQP